ncbi:MAG: S-layer protein [Theionarchaea archaeon]|nr:S-layer protein [Theionarchaea archaeon]
MEQNDLDRDYGQSNDCRNSDWSLQTECINQCDIEDPVMWHGPGIPIVEMNLSHYQDVHAPGTTWVIPGPHFGELYFFVHVTDTWFQGTHPDIAYETVKVNLRRRTTSNIDETCLIIYDSEFDFDAWKTDCNCNVILIGGHKANSVVNQLIQEGVSVINWATSSGEWEYIEAPYKGCDVLIIAGKDRESTTAAVQRLLRNLQSSQFQSTST